MTNRIYNFSAGPAVLPVPVLEQAQRDLVALPGVGMSVMEISHRSKTFERIIRGPRRTCARSPASRRTTRSCSCRAARRLQFSMVPMNMLTAGGTADYIMTGAWAEKAVKEARRVGTVHVAGSTEDDEIQPHPDAEPSSSSTPGAAYVHMTSNNTIYGTEWQRLPDVGGAPLVGDASSDIFSRPIDVSRYGADLRGRAEEPRARPA